MCEFKFLDMTPQDLIKIIEYDIKQYKRKIDHHTGIANTYKIKIEELADQQGIIQVNAEKENYIQARFASLDQNIIQPLLERWHFIEIEKIGRTRWIKITQEGINASEFLI